MLINRTKREKCSRQKADIIGTQRLEGQEEGEADRGEAFRSSNREQDNQSGNISEMLLDKKQTRPSLILSSIGKGSSGCMLAETRICLESSST